MASLNQVAQGMFVFGKYVDPDDCNGVCAEHDEVYAGLEAFPDKMSEDDKKKVEDLGWSWDSGLQSWRHFT